MNLPAFLNPNNITKMPRYAYGHIETNEKPEIHADLLNAHCTKFDRAASIASGGEIPLLVLLIRFNEVVAVDHSPRALTASYLKCLLLAELGPSIKTISTNYSGACQEIKKVSDKIPDNLRTFGVDQNIIFCALSRWKDVSDEHLELMRNSLGKLTFVLGDIRHVLHKFGTFDSLYISNATEHQGEDRTCPKLEDFLPVVNEGGVILSTRASNQIQNTPKGWHQAAFVPQTESHDGWSYFLHKRTAEV